MKIQVTQKLERWYQTRPVREQWMLAAGGMMIVIWFVWFAVINPLNQASHLTESRVASAQQALLEVRELSQQLIAARSQQPASAGSGNGGLAQWIYTTADQNGVALASVDLSADGMTANLRTEALPFRDTLEWLYAMESDSLARVDNVTLNPVPESVKQNAVVAVLSLRWR